MRLIFFHSALAKVLFFIFLFLTNAFAQTSESLIKPVKVLAIADLFVEDQDVFFSRIDATNRAQLSFSVAGQIDKIFVTMGQRVNKGDLLAKLDDVDFQLALQAAKAQHSLAKGQWERAKKLFKQSLISADKFEQQETNYKITLAMLEQAKTNLSYTQIHAPFSGIVSCKGHNTPTI